MTEIRTVKYTKRNSKRQVNPTGLGKHAKPLKLSIPQKKEKKKEMRKCTNTITVRNHKSCGSTDEGTST
jgi:hypothetical protein